MSRGVQPVPISQAAARILRRRGSCRKHSLTRVLYFFAEAIVSSDKVTTLAPALAHGGREGAIPASAEARGRERYRVKRSGAVKPPRPHSSFFSKLKKQIGGDYDTPLWVICDK